MPGWEGGPRAGRAVPILTGWHPAEQSRVDTQAHPTSSTAITRQTWGDKVKNQSGEHIQQVRISRSRAELRDTYSRAQAGTQCSDLSLSETPGNRGRSVWGCVHLWGGLGRGWWGPLSPMHAFKALRARILRSFLQVKIITPSYLMWLKGQQFIIAGHLCI